jgi:transcriptional regulator with XRE-family HTH domain
MTLGEKIKALRTERGWTQIHLAGASGLDERTIRRIERKNIASLETLQAIAAVFDLDCSELTSLLRPDPKPHTKMKIIVPRDGHELLNALSHQHAYSVNAEHTDDEAIAELIRSVLHAIEFREIWDDMSPSERYEEGRRFTDYLRKLHAKDWYVAVGLQTGTLLLPEIGDLKPSQRQVPNWITATVKVCKIEPERSETH